MALAIRAFRADDGRERALQQYEQLDRERGQILARFGVRTSDELENLYEATSQATTRIDEIDEAMGGLEDEWDF